MTHQEVLDSKEKIQINGLWSLENISDCYVLVGYNIINKVTKHIKTINKMCAGKGYLYVTLNEKITNKQKKVTLHKILALAYIHNGPYILIEHLDDNPDNCNIENLCFSNKSNNGKHAFENGCHSNKAMVFKLILRTGEIYIGTIKELTNITNVPWQTLYDKYYKGTSGVRIQSISLVTD